MLSPAYEQEKRRQAALYYIERGMPQYYAVDIFGITPTEAKKMKNLVKPEGSKTIERARRTRVSTSLANNRKLWPVFSLAAVHYLKNKTTDESVLDLNAVESTRDFINCELESFPKRLLEGEEIHFTMAHMLSIASTLEDNETYITRCGDDSCRSKFLVPEHSPALNTISCPFCASNIAIKKDRLKRYYTPLPGESA